MITRVAVYLVVSSLVFPGHFAQADPPCNSGKCPSSWFDLNHEKRKSVFELAEDYKSFMSVSRTDWSTVDEAVRRARDAEFVEWKPGVELRQGDRYYFVNRGRAAVFFVVGREPAASGLRIATAHIDSPHLTLKARPLYEKEGFALFQTDFHGAILNYQWANTPLALIGRIARKDGSVQKLSVGLGEDDPVLMIAGLSPHVDIDLRDRVNRDVLMAEELDPIVASIPAADSGSVLAHVLEYLQNEYRLNEHDFVSADLALVPAMSPRDAGLDRSMMAMHGQDDRMGAYAALAALLVADNPVRTSVVHFANNEETGGNNNTGAGSEFLTDFIAELVYVELGKAYRDVHFKRALSRSDVLSIDVNDAINPVFPEAWEKGNAPRLGHGVNIKVYGKGNNASPVYAAWIRRIFDEAGVKWQTTTYKVGRAGGGTQGGQLSRHNMDVIDIGAPVLSVHNIYGISSKADLWWLVNSAKAFFGAE